MLNYIYPFCALFDQSSAYYRSQKENAVFVNLAQKISVFFSLKKFMNFLLIFFPFINFFQLKPKIASIHPNQLVFNKFWCIIYINFHFSSKRASRKSSNRNTSNRHCCSATKPHFSPQKRAAAIPTKGLLYPKKFNPSAVFFAWQQTPQFAHRSALPRCQSSSSEPNSTTFQIASNKAA